MSTDGGDLVLVGGGIAAVRTAQMARELGFRGSIALVSDEKVPPYDRPPLSKQYLLGSIAEPVPLLTLDDARSSDIDLVLDKRVTSLNTAGRRLQLADGGELSYQQLVVATGCRARRLDALVGATDACYLRSADDAERLRGALRPGAHVAIVGGGFIGLEVASAAAAQGCRVTVIELMPLPLEQVLGETLALWLLQWHTDRGVTFLGGTTVVGAQGAELLLSSGERLVADVVVVGVGVERELGWLTDAGLTVDAGLVCDAGGRTNIPEVYGAGDVICLHGDDTCQPLQHWTAAVESARRVAHTIVGREQPVDQDDGFFWSDQSDLRLQSVGRLVPAGETVLVSGSLAEGSFVAQQLHDGSLTGVVASNAQREFLRHRVAFRQMRGKQEVVA